MREGDLQVNELKKGYEESIVVFRDEIDAIDREIESLLLKRFKITGEVAKLKQKSGVQTYDPSREAKMKQARENRLSHQEHQREVMEIFQYIIETSKRAQDKLRK